MKTPHASEYYALVVAAVVLLVVLVACYIAIQLYRVGSPSPGPCGNAEGLKAAPGPAKREGFLAPTFYSPACRSDFLGNTRAACRGFTTGSALPSIVKGKATGCALV